MQRSYEIADQFYPADTPPAQGESGGSILGDLGRLTIGGAVRGTGSAISGAGAMIDDIAQTYRGTQDQPGESLVRSGSRAAGEAVGDVGDAVADSVSEEMKAAQAGTQPGGELLDPSTWTLGDDPSLRGIAGIAAEGIGSMVPVVASALVVGPGAAAGVGGAMGGGEGASNARQFVMDAATTMDETGRPEIENLPAYQDLIAQGMNATEATSVLAQRAEADSAFAQSIPAALGGMATSRIISAADGWIGKGGRLARAAKKGAAGALEEGTQEAIEGVAGKAGLAGATGAELNLAEDTFSDFIGGALAGGGIGVAAGSLGAGQNPQGQPTDNNAPPDPLALPAPQPAQGGPLVPAPRQITSDPTAQNPDFAFPGLPAPEGAPAATPETGVVPAPRQIGFDPNVQNPNWSFPSGSPNPGADGSGTGSVAAPDGSLPLSGGDPGAAATILPMGALPGPTPPAGLLPPPAGPIDALAQNMPVPEVEPAPPPQRFPEHKPGSTVRLFDPRAGVPVDGVFIGESESGAMVRVGGQEIELDPAQFDSARDAAKVADELAKEEAKQQKAQRTKGGPTDPQAPAAGRDLSQLRLDDGRGAGSEAIAPQQDSVQQGTDDVSGLAGKSESQPTEGSEPGDRGGRAMAGDAGQPVSELTDGTDTELHHRAAFIEAANRREAAYDAWESTGSLASGPQKDEVDAAIKNLRSVRAASIRDLGKEKTEQLFAAADAATIADTGQQPVNNALQDPVAKAATEAAPDPSDGQKEAGNYRKGHARWNGLDLSIENQKGSRRSGTDPDGNAWSVTMPAHYGYFRSTEGADGDHVDFYMGDNESAQSAYVIDQVDSETGAYDEAKVMLGFDSSADARAAHEAAFSDSKGAARLGGIKKMTVPQLKEWLASDQTKKPVSMTHRRTVENPRTPAPQKRPLINYVIRQLGGIAPTGSVAEELKARGVSSKTAPGLWRKIGRAELDNIPAAEHPDLEALVGRSDDGLYLNPAAIVDAILEEIAGKPQPLGEQAILQQAARDAEAAETANRTGAIDADENGNMDRPIPNRDQDIRPDEDRRADIAGVLDGAIEDFGLYSALTYADREAIIEILDRDGGDVDDAIYDFLARGDDNAIRESSSDGREAAEIPDVPFGDERNDQRPERDDGAEDRSGTQSEGVPGSGEREGNDPDTASDDVDQQVATEAGAEGLPQQVIPGTERSDAQSLQAGSDRARLEMQARQQQSKMRRPNGNSGDAGPLFDSQQDLLSGVTSDATNDNAPESSGKIEDFGEKLEGARKDVWSSYADRMRDADDIDISAEPLSKSWPSPDYQKLIDAGVDPWTVSFIRVVRDAIPTKPQKAWRLKGWVQNVEALRELANRLMRGEITQSDIKSSTADIDTGKTNVLRSIELYEAVGHDKSLKGLRLNAAQYSLLDGQRHDPSLTRWEVTSAAKSTAFSNMPRVIAHGDTKEAALEAFKKAHATLDQQQDKAKKGPKFLIYSRRSAEGSRSYHVGVKIGRDHIDLRDVPDVKEARRLIAEEADALQAQLDRMRDIPNERRDRNSPRVGVDHRSGSDVSPEQFSDTFGFRGVQFGNWVEGGRRQQDLNEAYDALMDLAGILDLPPKALSLNGSLGLAFGARGSGGRNPAAAHYEPNQVVINLTKKQGRGSLAHEWFHAADNYFSRKRDRKDGFITDNSLPGNQVEGLRPELVDAFGDVRRAIAKTDLEKRSANIDKMRTSPYWSTGIEMHARAFESYVIAKLQDQNASNDYLANIVNGAAWGLQAEMSGLGDSYPYLKPDEIETVRPAFDALFETIQTRDTNLGVEMFSRFADREPVAELSGDELGEWNDIRQLGRKAEAWYRKNLVGTTVTNCP
ncbi:LPD5 domain-containing protein [Paracoccus onubensis]|uniref:LPD5 domain-containing protein n=1 Tax=Paracoccus onubensis TaxID=1675788 RepID=UPI002731FA9C|nr:LPD5 domain-containing protein [Paracoccus onubensis]MDP0928497.1 LPD5 domain-containing protein [Paracoccus onubensis]